MSRTVKWIVGVLAVLVVVAIVAGAVWFWQQRGQMMSYRYNNAQPNAPGYGQGNPAGPRGFDNNGGQPFRRMHPFGGPYGMPMMRGWRGGFGFGPLGMGLMMFGGLLRLLFPLALLALVAFLFYQLGKSSGRRLAPQERPTPPPASETDTNK